MIIKGDIPVAEEVRVFRRIPAMAGEWTRSQDGTQKHSGEQTPGPVLLSQSVHGNRRTGLLSSDDSCMRVRASGLASPESGR